MGRDEGEEENERSLCEGDSKGGGGSFEEEEVQEE